MVYRKFRKQNFANKISQTVYANKNIATMRMNEVKIQEPMEFKKKTWQAFNIDPEFLRPLPNLGNSCED